MRLTRRVALFVAVSPFAVFLLIFAANSRLAAWVAGTVAASVTDPLLLVTMAASFGMAVARIQWPYAVILGVGTVMLHVFMAHDWWVKVLGSDGANSLIFQVSFLDVALVMFAYFASFAAFHRDPPSSA